MNTTPKQQDDEGIAAADGSRPTLEQTVMGIAPSTSSPSPAGPPPLVASPAEPPAEADVVIVAAPTIAVADGRAPVSAAEADAPRPDDPAQTEAARTDVSTLSGTASSDIPASTDAPLPTPTIHAPGLGETLPLAWSPPAAPSPEPREIQQTSAAATANGALDHTALSADYLREAREAALSALTSGKTPSDGSPAAVSSAATAPASASTTASMPMAPNVLELDAPPNVGARPSIAAPLPGATAAGTERIGVAPTVGRGFEPVPVLRAPLAESLSGALSPIVELGGHRSLPPSTRLRPQTRKRETAGRWLLLASVALATVGVVTLASNLVGRYRNSATRTQAAATSEQLAVNTEAPIVTSPSAASRALMPNRPAPERATADGRPQVVFATGAPGATAATERATAASAGPESQLAATAGRHVLSGNYAEALPLYRELERNWPENTAYAAMARLLEKRVGSTNDTRTISPTTPKP